MDTVVDIPLFSKLNSGRRDGFASDARFTHLKRPDKASVHTRAAFCGTEQRAQTSESLSRSEAKGNAEAVLYCRYYIIAVIKQRF